MNINVTLPDGSVRSYAPGATAMDVAKSISEGLARNVLSAKVNGEVRDANRPLPGDCTLSLLTWNDDEGKATLWHSSAHLLAEAIEALYPGTKFGIGPAIEKGFYYDIDLGGRTIGDSDFAAIEAKMRAQLHEGRHLPRCALIYERRLRRFLRMMDVVVRLGVLPPASAPTSAVLHALGSRRPHSRYLIGLDAWGVWMVVRHLPESVVDRVQQLLL